MAVSGWGQETPAGIRGRDERPGSSAADRDGQPYPTARANKKGAPEGALVVAGDRAQPPIDLRVPRYSMSEVNSSTVSPAARPAGIMDCGRCFSSFTSVRLILET